MAPRSKPEAGSPPGATSIPTAPTAGSSEAAAADSEVDSEAEESLAEESVVKVCKQCMLSSSEDEVVCPSCGSPLVPIRSVRESYVGETIDGRYRLVRKIGSGGMGTVYLGVDDSRDEKVAVKFLAKKYAANEQIIMRFLNEARSYGRVTHPNAVTLKEYGQHDDGALYLITEFVDGEPLSQAVQGAGPLTPGAAISVAGQVCGVLSAAHREGVIHRDLKPDNIMLVEDSNGQYHAKVLDFGIAKIVDDERATLTQTGAVFGTPEFMSPEQARGDVADARADIYALGLILFYSTTGTRPFESQNQYKLLDMQQHQPPPRPSNVSDRIDVPAPLERIILTCLEKEPEDRYDSAIDLRVELERVAERLNTGPVTAVDEERERESGELSTDVDNDVPRGGADEDDTLFLRPFELARRAGVDSVEESDVGGTGAAGSQPGADSMTYAEPGVSGEFERAEGDETGARREPGGSLKTDLRVADGDSNQTPHPGDTSLPTGMTSTTSLTDHFVGQFKQGIDGITAGVRSGVERLSAVVGADDEGRDDDTKWALTFETPDWGEGWGASADGEEDVDVSGAGGRRDGFDRATSAVTSGTVAAILAIAVAGAGAVWGWSQLREAPASGESAGLFAADDADDESTDAAPETKRQAGLERAAERLEAGELAKAESMLRELAAASSGSDATPDKAKDDDREASESGGRRAELLRTIGRMRRLENSLERSLEERACGRASRTLKAIGAESPGLKASHEEAVESCGSIESDRAVAESDRGSEPSAGGPEDGDGEPSEQRADTERQNEAEEHEQKASANHQPDDAATEEPEQQATANETDDEGARAGQGERDEEGEATSAAGAPSENEGARKAEETAGGDAGGSDAEGSAPEESSAGDGAADRQQEATETGADQEGASGETTRETTETTDEAEKAGGDQKGQDDDMALPPKQM